MARLEGSTQIPQHFGARLADVDEPDRHVAIREVFGRGWLNVEFDAYDERPAISAEIDLLPGVSITRGSYSPHRARTLADLSLGDDDVAFCWVETPGNFELDHLSQVRELKSGEAVLTSCADRMQGRNDEVAYPTTIKLTRKSVLPMLESNDVLGRTIAANDPAFRLLRQYLDPALEYARQSGPEGAGMVAHQISDLVILALGASADGRAMATERGQKAARYAAICEWIDRNHFDPSLSIQQCCVKFALGRRAIQSLLAEHGTSFTRKVRERRLLQAYRLLGSPDHAASSISEIAYSVGFGDLSYFNRRFRDRFGKRPGDVRREAH